MIHGPRRVSGRVEPITLPDQRLTPGDGRDARWLVAVGDLYQACHLRPPGVLVARDALDQARLIRLMAPIWTQHQYFCWWRCLPCWDRWR